MLGVLFLVKVLGVRELKIVGSRLVLVFFKFCFRGKICFDVFSFV